MSNSQLLIGTGAGAVPLSLGTPGSLLAWQEWDRSKLVSSDLLVEWGDSAGSRVRGASVAGERAQVDRHRIEFQGSGSPDKLVGASPVTVGTFTIGTVFLTRNDTSCVASLSGKYEHFVIGATGNVFSWVKDGALSSLLRVDDPVIDGKYHCAITQFTGSHAGHSVRIDGAPATTVDITADAVTGREVTGDYWIGGREDGAARPLNGLAGAHLLLSPALPAADVLILDKYLCAIRDRVQKLEDLMASITCTISVGTQSGSDLDLTIQLVDGTGASVADTSRDAELEFLLTTDTGGVASATVSATNQVFAASGRVALTTASGAGTVTVTSAGAEDLRFQLERISDKTGNSSQLLLTGPPPAFFSVT